MSVLRMSCRHVHTTVGLSQKAFLVLLSHRKHVMSRVNLEGARCKPLNTFTT